MSGERMPDREKVIEGLSACWSDVAGSHCGLCPYEGDEADISCCKRLQADAIALLKAQEQEVVNLQTKVAELTILQEPRLVTEADFDDDADIYGFLPVWTEEREGDVYCECITKSAVTDPDSTGEYRCWTSRPTDAQREVVAWDS